MTKPRSTSNSTPSRRQFLGQALTSATAVAATSWLAGCSSGTTVPTSGSAVTPAAPGVLASDAPEVSELRVGMIALTDCSPFVVAHELGLFKKYGLNVTVAKQASWAAIRDALSTGDLHATHMLLGMPIASTMGLLGSPKKPMIIPWLINRNGQAITLKSEYKGKVAADPKALKPFVEAAKTSGTPLTFAMTFPPGTHAMWLRYYLAAGGIHPDRDVSLIVVPPPQMIANMKVGKMDGFCVGEPWNARCISDSIGYTAITTQEIWQDHPEKVCAFTQEFADKHPKTVKAFLKGLHDASVWLDDFQNRKQQSEIVSKATYINCPPDLILGRLLGQYDYGDGRTAEDKEHCMYFSRNNCNFPQPKYAQWWLTQFRRWGMVTGEPDYKGVAEQVMRHDLYAEAMREISYESGGLDEKPETLFDGAVFDPQAPEKYATSFAVHALKD